MTSGNYIKHFKILGKLCKLYDTAGASAAADQLLLATTADQIADGTVAGLPAVILFQGYIGTWNAAISAGPTALQNLALAYAGAYLVNSTFTADLTTTPTSATVANVLAALQTEMGAGVDNKTLSTETTSGLVNFFDVLEGSEGTWNTAGSPDYPDSTYVVSSVV